MSTVVGAVKSRRAEHAEDTRNALLDAATEVFADQGYAATGIDAIAERARVTKGAVYHHFANKQDLFRAVVERLYEQAVERLVQMGAHQQLPSSSDEPQDLWDLICAGYRAYLDVVSEDPAFQRLVYQEAPAILGHEEIVEIASAPANTLLHPLLEEAVGAGLIPSLDTETLSHLLGALIGRASFEIATADKPDDARRRAGDILDALLQGLRQRQRS